MEKVPGGPIVPFNGAAVLDQPAEGPSTMYLHMSKNTHVLFRFPKKSAGDTGELRPWREGIIGQVTGDGVVSIVYESGKMVNIARQDYADQIKFLEIAHGFDDTPSVGPAVITSTNAFDPGQHLLFRVATNANGVGRVQYGEFREGVVQTFNDRGVSIEYKGSNGQTCIVFIEKTHYEEQLRLHVREAGQYDI